MSLNNCLAFQRARDITKSFVACHRVPIRVLEAGSTLHRGIGDAYKGARTNAKDATKVHGHEADNRWTGLVPTPLGVGLPGVGALYLTTAVGPALNELIWYEFRDVALANALMNGNQPLKTAVDAVFRGRGLDDCFTQRTLYEFTLTKEKKLVDLSDPQSSSFLDGLGKELDADSVIAAECRTHKWRGAIEQMFHSNDYSIARGVGAALLANRSLAVDGLYAPSARKTLRREGDEGNVVLLPETSEFDSQALKFKESVLSLRPVRARKFFAGEPKGETITIEELRAVLSGPKHFVIEQMVDPQTGEVSNASASVSSVTLD